MEKRPTKEEKEQILLMFKRALDENDAELFFIVINAVIGYTFLAMTEGGHNEKN